jgi:hypothetical protein
MDREPTEKDNSGVEIGSIKAKRKVGRTEKGWLRYGA